MTTDAVQKATRGTSPVILILAALCFLLPFVGVSCNTGAAQSQLGPALRSLGGAGGSQAAQATQCIQGLANRDLATYSGFSLAFGGNPNTDTSNIPGCDTGGTSTPSPGGDQGNIGVQPLMLIAFILVVAGGLASILPAAVRSLAAGGAALVAAVLLIINDGTVSTPIINKLTASSGGSLSQIGISGGLGGFFNIHAAIGFWLALVALVVAVVVNGAAILLARGVLPTTTPSGGPPGGLGWAVPGGAGAGPAPPPPPPPA
jgi:hypothetical protein